MKGPLAFSYGRLMLSGFVDFRDLQDLSFGTSLSTIVAVCERRAFIVVKEQTIFARRRPGTPSSFSIYSII